MPVTKDYANLSKISWIEYSCICAGRIPNYGNIFLVLAEDKKVYLTSSFTLKDQSIFHDLPATYLLINLNKPLSRMSPRNFREAGVDVLTIDSKTLEILKTTANNNVHEVIIHKKENEIDSIESLYFCDKAKTHELIDSIGYGEINLTIKNGKVVHTKSLSRKKSEK